MNPNSGWIIAKRAFTAAVLLYVLGIFFFFLYVTVEVGPFGGLWLTDALLVRGPIVRLMNPVTSDEKMIANFQNLRPQFDRLVEVHKEKCLYMDLPDVRREHPEVTQLRQQLGLVDLKSGSVLWLPDPYSKKAFDQRREMDREIQRKMQSFGPATLANAPERRRTADADRIRRCRYMALRIDWEKFPASSNLVKGLTHFPIDPKVEQGHLVRPSDLDPGQPYDYEEVQPSLNGVPAGFWGDLRRCVYRKIEPQWFLSVCPS